VIDELRNKYIDVIAKQFPSRAILWGKNNYNLGDFSKHQLENYITSLNELICKIDSIENTECINEKVSLKRAILYRKFEIETLALWKTKPQFYAANALKGISIHWRNLEAIEHGYFDQVAVKEKLNQLSSFFNIALSNLSDGMVSKLDILLAVNLIKTEWNSIIKKAHLIGLRDNEINYLNKVVQKFIVDLKNLNNGNNQPFLIPLGREKFERLLYLESGLKVSSESLLEDVKTNIKENHYIFSNPREKAIGVEFNDLFDKNTITKLEEYFGELLNCGDLKICKTNIFSNVKGFHYIKSYNLSSKEPKGIAFCPYGQKITDRQVLGIVHETYPGHHFSYCVQFKKNRLASILYHNSIFEEGWAKFAEEKYVQIRPELRLEHAFYNSFRKMVVLAFAALKIHAFETEINKVIHEISKIFDYDISTAKSICIQAYDDPIQAISYFLGYNYVKWQVSKCNKKIDLFIKEMIEEHDCNMEGLSYDEIRRV
jgi:hypothetical protein